LKAFGGILDAVGKFVPQLKQVGDMFKQVSSAFDAVSQMTAKFQEAENQRQQEQARNAAVKPKPAPTPAATPATAIPEPAAGGIVSV
ncbi:MAG: hypothetical protein VKO21_08610, partial [Candidatus Sericytochromatia bacterium]|nr:hypothetical protein [Candidatus Sericytochromatia bacterium]